ncbi:hypothetical protein BJX99DRAFT_258608 [Aspergillus californicus]
MHLILLSWSLLLPFSFSTPLTSMSMSMSMSTPLPPSNPHSLTCPQLTFVNEKLDAVLHNSFPPSVPQNKIYAVESFTHAYKFLVNTMHHSDCPDESSNGLTPIPMSNGNRVGEKTTKEAIMSHYDAINLAPRGGGDDDYDDEKNNTIICLVLDALLEGTGGSSVGGSVSSGSGRGRGGQASFLPAVNHPDPKGVAKVVGWWKGGAGLVRRQDTGIGQQILTLLGEILDVVLECPN